MNERTAVHRTVVFERTGGPEVLRIIEEPLPQLGPDQLSVCVVRAGVNPIDWKIRSGRRAVRDAKPPHRIGSDGSGIVTAVGASVSGFIEGDSVIIHSALGTYATHMVVEADNLAIKPDGLGWDAAAAIGTPWATAYQCLRSLRVTNGDVLLLHGGSGAVGQAVIQLAVREGARVVATASSANLARVSELGAIPVEYRNGLLDRLRKTAPGGFSVALVAAGADEAIEASLDLVQDRNRIGTIVHGQRADEWGIRAWRGGSPRPLTAEEQQWRAEAPRIVAGLAVDGSISIEIGQRYPLEQVADAHRASESGSVRGKIILDTTL